MRVTVERGAGVDRHGDPLPGGSTFQEDGWSFAPRSSSESDDRANGVVIGLTGYGPRGSAVRPADVFVIDGQRYEVEGEPGDWSRAPDWIREPLRSAAGVEVALTRYRG